MSVGCFESRRGTDMAALIAKYGGVARVSPSLREVEIRENPSAKTFIHELLTGNIDVVIFLTGVGFKHLLTAVEKIVPRQRYLDALTDVVTICRGPKPVAAMKEVGLTPTHRVPEPNTWRDLLATIDAGIPIYNQGVALQEYGKSNSSLIAGLESRGARVLQVRVYEWELPEDTAPLEANVKALAAGELDVILFTSAHQAVNLITIAQRLNLMPQVEAALRTTVVASIGPTTSEMLRDLDWPVDIEPLHPKMGHLVIAAAEQTAEIKKRKAASIVHVASPQCDVLDPRAPWYDSLFMKACRREPTEVTPVWLMRQAGRYMSEYRSVRHGLNFLELCKRPDLCCEVMITAVNKLGVDAAILFADLLPILEPMGMDLEFVAGDGPTIHNPMREGRDVERLKPLESVESLQYTFDAVKLTRRELPANLPLIGFAGAPFTLASYCIEGGGSKTYLHTKALMYRDSGAWKELMTRLTTSVVKYLSAQVAAGCQCLQIFDSWVGCLGPDDYKHYVLPHMKRMIADLPRGVPVIYFAAGNPALLPLVAETSAQVIGLDWRGRLDDGWNAVGHRKAVQGNLDPSVLMADQETIRIQAKAVLDQANRRPGHIFNLGHGIHQQTPVENAVALVKMVHEMSQK